MDNFQRPHKGGLCAVRGLRHKRRECGPRESGASTCCTIEKRARFPISDRFFRVGLVGGEAHLYRYMRLRIP